MNYFPMWNNFNTHHQDISQNAAGKNLVVRQIFHLYDYSPVAWTVSSREAPLLTKAPLRSSASSLKFFIRLYLGWSFFRASPVFSCRVPSWSAL
jgi:hypothetical protein